MALFQTACSVFCCAILWEGSGLNIFLAERIDKKSGSSNRLLMFPKKTKISVLIGDQIEMNNDAVLSRWIMRNCQIPVLEQVPKNQDRRELSCHDMPLSAQSVGMQVSLMASSAVFTNQSPGCWIMNDTPSPLYLNSCKNQNVKHVKPTIHAKPLT